MIIFIYSMFTFFSLKWYCLSQEINFELNFWRKKINNGLDLGGQVYDQYTMQPQLVTSVPSGQFQQLPGGGQYPAAIPTPVQQEDYNSYAAQSGGFYVPAASYPQVYYK